MSRNIHPTRGTRIHPKGLQSPLEGCPPPHSDIGRIKAPFAGTTCSTSFLKPLLFEHGRGPFTRVRGRGSAKLDFRFTEFYKVATVFIRLPCGERYIADTRRRTVPPLY